MIVYLEDIVFFEEYYLLKYLLNVLIKLVKIWFLLLRILKIRERDR